MLRANHKLWLYRNQILHAQTENGLSGMDIVQLREMITKQMDRVKTGMLREDWYLLDVNIHDLIVDSVESIRGWLYNVMIARGDMAAAREENIKDRQHTNVASNNITEQQRNEFMNCRNKGLK